MYKGLIIILIIIILIGTTSNEIVMSQVAGLSCSGAGGHERLCDTARGSRLQVQQHTDRLARERVRSFGHTYERIAEHKIDANRLAVDPCEMKSLQAFTIVISIAFGVSKNQNHI